MKRMRAVLALAVMAMAAGTAAAQSRPAPRLVVAISVDQFSADLYAQYRATFTAGLKRLGNGAVFPSGYQSHAATETCPGHSTILTGVHPARTGIIANGWIDPANQRLDKEGKPTFRVYCAEDPRIPGSSPDKYIVSPWHLKVPTLGDRLKMADPAARVVAVAGKDRAAVMMGGHAIDQAWWYNAGRFETFADRIAAPPSSVVSVNARVAALIARPSRPAIPAQCARAALPVGVDNGLSVGVPVAAKAGDAAAFRATGDLDQQTMALAIGLIGEMKLGRGNATDVLAVGLSATDYIGHSFGTNGGEMCAQLANVDALVGSLLDMLDRSGIDYVVVLTADHGGHDLPERNRQRALAAAQRGAPDVAAINARVAAAIGMDGSVIQANDPFGDYYLDRAVPDALRPRALSALQAELLAEPGVAAVYTREELARRAAYPDDAGEWPLIDRVRASYDPTRSGDLVVLQKPWITPILKARPGYVATHGSPWNYDRRVPILFWRKGMSGFEQPNAVETVDILPTLAALIGLPVPMAEIDGHCLDLDPGEGSTCD